MIGAISDSRTSAVDASNKAKEAALQSQIDQTDAKANTVGCADTSAKLKKDASALKAQLAALQAADGGKGASSSSGAQQPQRLAGPEAAARQAEFDDDLPDETTTAALWV